MTAHRALEMRQRGGECAVLRDAVADSALGYTAEEIAAEHGQNPNTIQNRLARGRKQLRRALRLKDAPTLLALRSMLARMAPLRQLNSYS